MSQVREFPSQDSESRQERADDIEILDVREISGESFDKAAWVDTVYELDAVNEDGNRRENITVIPAILFENTKDVQYRHSHGIVGKYTRALVRENEDARADLMSAIDAKRAEVQEEIRELKEKDARLMHTKLDVKDSL